MPRDRLNRTRTTENSVTHGDSQFAPQNNSAGAFFGLLHLATRDEARARFQQLRRSGLECGREQKRDVP